MKHYSTTEARKHFSEIIEQVRYLKAIVSVGRRGEEEVLIVPKPEINEDLQISAINASSSSFDFVEDEPDIYSLKDLKKRYV